MDLGEEATKELQGILLKFIRGKNPTKKDLELAKSLHQYSLGKEFDPSTWEDIYGAEDHGFEIPIVEEEVANLSEKFPNLRVMYEIRKATDWLRATGKRYKDYPAFMRNWLRRAQERQQPQPHYKEPVERNRTYVEGEHI